jgi:hypothetical protein
MGSVDARIASPSACIGELHPVVAESMENCMYRPSDFCGDVAIAVIDPDINDTNHHAPVHLMPFHSEVDDVENDSAATQPRSIRVVDDQELALKDTVAYARRVAELHRVAEQDPHETTCQCQFHTYVSTVEIDSKVERAEYIEELLWKQRVEMPDLHKHYIVALPNTHYFYRVLWHWDDREDVMHLLPMLHYLPVANYSGTCVCMHPFEEIPYGEANLLQVLVDMKAIRVRREDHKKVFDALSAAISD